MSEPSQPRPQFRLHASVLVTDAAGRLLIVQEGKPQTRNRWNLPGGHVDHAEAIAIGAARETREETGLALPLTGLLGIYSSEMAVRFVFLATLQDEHFHAGDEILDVKLIEPQSLLGMADAELVSPSMFRQIIRDLSSGKSYPLEAINGPKY
jgi:ADP-ribose pyrophosphatase YjhB (NUDIX family)